MPLLIVLENNFYAQSTSQTETLAGEICARATAFGIETTHSNTCDPQKLVQHEGIPSGAPSPEGRCTFESGPVLVEENRPRGVDFSITG